MWGSKQFFLVATAVMLLLGAGLWFALASTGPAGLQIAALGWGAMALIGVVGGTLAVHFHGRAGAAFPLTLVTCILLRLFSGLGGIVLALRSDQLTAYLTALFATFVVTLAFEMFWFLRRGKLLAAGAIG